MELVHVRGQAWAALVEAAAAARRTETTSTSTQEGNEQLIDRLAATPSSKNRPKLGNCSH
jgi:hypothetical protein